MTNQKDYKHIFIKLLIGYSFLSLIFITMIRCYSSYFGLTKTNYLCFSLAFGGLRLLQGYQKLQN